jgi:glycosyltransferase involved in cell wall biosynthesis
MLERALNSIERQTLPDPEVVVVDDGSTDDTVGLLGSRSDVKTITSLERIGAAAARNLGIASATGRYIAFLDSDDEYLPEKLELQASFLESNPSVGAVYCRHIAIDDRTGRARQSDAGMYRGWIHSTLLAGRCPHTTSLFMVRADALRDCGGFDPELAGFQDTDLWLRMSKSWQFDYVDRHLVAVHSHDGQRLTTNIEERTLAVNAFLTKWGREMESVMGAEGVARYRRDKLAVAQGFRVLELVEAGERRSSIHELKTYVQLAGITHPRQLAGLLAAVTLGPGAHGRLKAALARE